MEFPSIVRAIWFLLVISLVKESTCLRGPWINVPATVKVGDTVTFKCEYDVEGIALYSLKWYFNAEEFFRYVPKQEPPYMHFRVKNIKVSESGPTHITFNKVNKAQSGTYECEVSTDAPTFETGLRRSTMTVVVPPTTEPSMKINQNRMNIGATLSAECSSPVSDPAANITWSINNEEISENKENVKILPLATFKKDDLTGSTSKIQIVTENSNFIEGVLRLKCKANIFNIWSSTVEMKVEADRPIKKMAGLTIESMSSQQSQMNSTGSGINI